MNLADVLRAAGSDVMEHGDWQHRVRPGDWVPNGVIVHHTAGLKTLRIVTEGRSDLPGPLANLYIDKTGCCYVVSGGRANHAGAGSQKVLDEVRRDIAPTGTAAARGLTDGPVGNGSFYGFECENLGDGNDPWPVEQLHAIARAAAALCRHHGWTANRVIGHLEWTRRKPDPRGFPMDAMRRMTALYLHPPDEGDDDVKIRIIKEGSTLYAAFGDGRVEKLTNTDVIEGWRTLGMAEPVDHVVGTRPGDIAPDDWAALKARPAI